MIKHKSKSLADMVFEQLESEILKGEIRLGSIITELGVSARLNVSRTPVREAFRRLEQEHMISETSRGMLVVGITDQEADSIYEIRERIEGLAAARAARNATAEQLQEMKDVLALQEFYLERNDPEKMRLYDNRFHELFYNASGSLILSDTLTDLHRKVMKYRQLSVRDTGRAPVSTKEHTEIYNAILAHDPEAAERAAAKHVQNAHRAIVRIEKELDSEEKNEVFD